MNRNNALTDNFKKSKQQNDKNQNIPDFDIENVSIKFFIIVLKAMLLAINTDKYNRFIKLIKVQELKGKPQWNQFKQIIRLYWF